MHGVALQYPRCCHVLIFAPCIFTLNPSLDAFFHVQYNKELRADADKVGHKSTPRNSPAPWSE